MRVRNAVYLPDGRIDCEINHPTAGWMPFTASPHDPEPHGRIIYDAIKDTAKPYAPQDQQCL